DVNVKLACHGWFVGMSNWELRAALPATCCATACRENIGSPPRGLPVGVVVVCGEFCAGVDGVMPNRWPIARNNAELRSSEKGMSTFVRYGLNTAVSLCGLPRNSE